MITQFSDNDYRRGFIEKPVLSYEIKINQNKPGIKNPNKGKWEITSITHYFASGLVEKDGTVSIANKVKVEVTDESRDAIRKAKNADETRIKEERKERRKGFSVVYAEDLGSDFQCQSDLIETRLDSIDFERALSKLTSKHQEVIRLKYYEDLKGDDIGKILGIGKSAVSRLLKRALAELKKILEEQMGE